MSKHKKVQSKTNEPYSHQTHEKAKTTYTGLKKLYVEHYKSHFLIVVFLTLFAIGSIGYTYYKIGDFTYRDVSLKGGVSLTITTNYQDFSGLEQYLDEKFPKSSINTRTLGSSGNTKGIIIEASDLSDKDLIAAVEEKTGKLSKENYSVETMGSSLGDSFFKQMFIALIIAFLFMGIVFHIYFANIYGTFAALLSAFLDIFITLGVMNVLGIRLTAGGIAAYLMLIGYSVDTSILLSTKLLKEKKEDSMKALFGAMKTGLTMSAAGIASTGLSYLFTNNIILKQIMLILIVGLVVDIITTWIGNVTLLRMYLEKKHVKD